MVSIKATSIDKKVVVQNILDMYYTAARKEHLAGLNWYKVALDEAYLIWGLNPNIGIEQTIGIISALSPRNKWYRNLQDAENLVRQYKVGDLSSLLEFQPATFGTNKLKAILIASMADPSSESILKLLNGNKVKSFYLNILNPDSDKFVTVDGHAANIALGTNKVTYTLNTKTYNLLVDYYKEAASIVSILPNQIQAVTWLAYRRLYIPVR